MRGSGVGCCQLRTVLGNVEFADNTGTCSAASSGSAVEDLFDDATLHIWSQQGNAPQGTDRIL